MEQTIELSIRHGMVPHSFDDQGSKIAWARTDPDRVHEEILGSIQDITLADLHDLASTSIQTAFNINTKACKEEHGGRRFAAEIYVLVDVDDEKDEYQLTRMNIPNENSWEACKHLIAVAKGTVKVVYLFAVDRGFFMERWLMRIFAPFA